MHHRQSILIARSLSERLVNQGLGEEVAYLPNLEATDWESIGTVLAEHRPTALLIGGQRLGEEALGRWRHAMGEGPLAVVWQNESDGVQATGLGSRYGID